MTTTFFKRKIVKEAKNKEPPTIKQNVEPAEGQKYKDSGCGFMIKHIAGPFAICQLMNGQTKRIPLKLIPTYELETNQEKERPMRRFRLGY